MVCSCSWLIFAKFKLLSYRRWGPTLDIFFCLRVPGPLKTVMNSVQKQKCPSYQRETDCIFLRFLGSNHSWSSLAISGFRWVCLLLRNITLIYDPGFNRESWFWKDNSTTKNTIKHRMTKTVALTGFLFLQNDQRLIDHHRLQFERGPILWWAQSGFWLPVGNNCRLLSLLDFERIW